MLGAVAPKALGEPLHVVMYGAFVVLTSVAGRHAMPQGIGEYRYHDAVREDAGGVLRGWKTWVLTAMVVGTKRKWRRNSGNYMQP